MLNGHKILITGASGLIGRAIVSGLLKENNCKLRVQVRHAINARAIFDQNIDLKQLDIVECDFTKWSDRDSKNLIEDCDFVIHLAGLVHQSEAQYQDYELLNVRTTKQLVKAAEAGNVSTFVFFSSSAVYGNGPFSFVDEERILDGKTPYAVSKIECERIVQNSKNIRRTIIFRPSLVFGEGDRGNLIKLIQSMNKKRYVQIGRGNTTKSLIYAKDAANAVILCLRQLPDNLHVFNLANLEAVSMEELACEIWGALGHKGQIPSISEPLLLRAVTVADKFAPGLLPINKERFIKLTTETTLNIGKLNNLTGFKPNYDLKEAIKSEIMWAKDKGLI